MFSGIIEELGEVRTVTKRGRVSLFEIKADKVMEGTAIGDSISVNGICLTVVKMDRGALTFEVIPETLRVSGLGSLRPSGRVNLERSLKVGSRISGHFVSGHADCVGVIARKSQVNNNLSFQINCPPEFLKYVLPKGSVAVDGISLTIADKKPGGFNVYIIPHTLKNTTLGFKGPSDKVNLEFDMLAKRLDNRC